LCGLFECDGLATIEDDPHALLCQGYGAAFAQPLAGAADDGGATGDAQIHAYLQQFERRFIASAIDGGDSTAADAGRTAQQTAAINDTVRSMVMWPLRRSIRNRRGR
jgi:hypothetical protein